MPGVGGVIRGGRFPILAALRSRYVIALVALVAVLAVGIGGYLLFGPKTAAATPSSARLTIFTGTVQVTHSGSTAAVAGHSGDQLHDGDQVAAGSTTKAALNFPDGSVTRLDSGTAVVVKAVDRNTDGSTTVSLSQSAGKTWSSVKKLVGLAKFNVSGPNNATAEVRGTEFALIIDVLPNGTKVVHLDVFTGTVDANSQNTTVTVGSGNSTIIGPGAAPTPVAPIPPADLQDSWTVFNQTFDVSQGSPVGFSTNTLNQGDTTALTPGATADGSSDLDFTLGWPGSTFELMVFAPDGT